MFCFWEIALANLIEERNVKSIYLLTKNSVNAKFGQKNNRPEPVVFCLQVVSQFLLQAFNSAISQIENWEENIFVA